MSRRLLIIVLLALALVAGGTSAVPGPALAAPRHDAQRPHQPHPDRLANPVPAAQITGTSQRPARRPTQDAGRAGDARHRFLAGIRAAGRTGHPQKRPPLDFPPAIDRARAQAAEHADDRATITRGRTAARTLSVARSAADCASTVWCAVYNLNANQNPPPTYKSYGYEHMTIRNAGSHDWGNQIHLSYHVTKPDGTVVTNLGLTTEFSGTVPAGGTLDITGKVQMLPAGTFHINWDLYRTPDTGGRVDFSSGYGSPGAVQILTIPHYDPTAGASNPFQDYATVSTLTPTLQGIVYSDDTKQVYGRIRLCEVGTTSCWGVGSSDPWIAVPRGAFAGSFQWTVPSGAMRYYHDYTWAVVLKDGTTVLSGSSTPLHLTAVVPQPAQSNLGSDASFLDRQGVNMQAGQFVRSEVDLTLPGINGPIGMQRTYNSADTANHAFGTGWSSLLDSTWSATSDNSFITVRFPDGKVRKYGRNPDGTYAGAPGEKDLRRVFEASRSIAIGGIQYTFSTTTGKLTSIYRGPGDVTRLNVDPSSGLVTSIDDVYSGRAVYLSWSGGHVVAESTGPGRTGLVWTLGYTGNQLTSACDARGTSYCETYTYTTAAPIQLTKVTPTGNTGVVTLTYTAGEITKVARPDGSWTYTAANPGSSSPDANIVRRVQVVDPRTTTWFGYDEDGFLLMSWRGHANPVAGDPRHSYQYNYAGQLVGQIDENNNGTTYAYDPITGKIETVLRFRDDVVIPGQPGRYSREVSVSYAYDTSFNTNNPQWGETLWTANADNQKVRYTYLANGLLATKAEPLRHTGTDYSTEVYATTSYVYTCNNDGSQGTPPAVVNDPSAPAGATQPCGLLSAETDATNKTTTYSYNRFGDVTRVVTPSGKRTDTTYDAYGRPVRQVVSSPQNTAGAAVDFTYDEVGHLLTETHAPVTNPVTGAVHQLQIVNDVLANGTVYSTTEKDLVADPVSGTSRRTTFYGYDAMGRQTTVSQGAVVTSRTTYNAFGQPTTTYDANNNQHTYTYTATGQLATDTLVGYVNPSWVNPAGAVRNIAVQRYTYDAGGRLATSQRPRGATTSYTYTSDDLQVSEEYISDHGTVLVHSYSYDLVGNVVSDKAGSARDGYRTTTMTYTDGNRRATVTVDPTAAGSPSPLNRTTSYVYDDAGRLTGTSVNAGGSRTESSTMEYGADGQLAKSQVENGSTDLTTQYTRDAFGNPLTVTDPRGAVAIGASGTPDPAYTTTYGYDAQGRPSTISRAPVATEDGSGSAATTARATTTMGYDAFGEVTEVADPRGAVTHREFDTRGRVVRESVPPPNDATYASTVAADSPAAWWKLADTGSSAADAAGSRTGSYTGPATGHPLVEGATLFDGATKATLFQNNQTWATLPATGLLTGDAAIEVWFRLPDAGPDTTNTLLRAGSQATIELYGDQVSDQVSILGSRGNAVVTLDRDRVPWHQMVLSFQGAAATYYVDGKQVATSSASGSQTALSQILVGSDGVVDDSWASAAAHVSVYGQALSRDRVAAHFAAARGATQQRTYDGVGNIATRTDARGATTSYQYDALNRKVKTTYQAAGGAAAGYETVAYDDNGNVVAHYAVSGQLTTQAFDSTDRMTSRTVYERIPEDVSSTTAYTYNDFNERLSEANTATGESTTVAYDKAGEVVRSTTAGAGTTTWTYDLAGRPLTQTDPAPQNTVTTNEYDLAGRQVTQTVRAGDGSLTSTTRAGFDGAGNQTSSTDPLGRVWTSTYDAANQVTSIVDPRPTSGAGVLLPSPTITYGYDLAGNPTRTTDGNGQTSYATFDLAGNRVTEVKPWTTAQTAAADRTWSTSYDPGGQPVKEVQPGGVTLTWQYDALGRLVHEGGTGGAASASRDLTWSPAGTLMSVNEPGGTESFTYNDAGQALSSYHLGVDGTAVADEFYYDSYGRLSGSRDTTGYQEYRYNSSGQLSQYSDSVGGANHAITYDAAGRPSSVLNYVGGQAKGTRSYGYDGLGRQVSDTTKDPSGQITARLENTWDLNGNLTTEKRSGAGFATSDVRYTYDEDNRLLTSYDAQAGTGADYGWDAAGNRTTATTWTGSPGSSTVTRTTTATYDERNRLTGETVTGPGGSAVSSATYGYDPRGNQTQRVSTVPGSTTTATSGYDAFGRMATDSSAGAGSYTYDGLDRLVGTPGTSQRLVYQGTGREPVAGPGGWAVSRLAGTAPIAVRNATGATGYDVVQDVHGDVVATVNPATGALVGTRTYDAFGSVVGGGTSVGPVGWQGSYTDPTSGKVHADARWYSPGQGRFTASDPAAPGASTNVASANLYGYGNANPSTFSDPSGLNPFGSLLGAVGGFLEGGLTEAAHFALWEAELAIEGAGVVGGISAETAAFLGEGAIALAPEAAEGIGVALFGPEALAIGAIVVVVVVGGVVAYQLLKPSPTTTTTTPPQYSPQTPATGPSTSTASSTQVETVHPEPTVTGHTVTREKDVSKQTKKWFDSQNVYVQVVTTITTTTTTVVSYSDGTSTTDVDPDSKTRTRLRTIPLFDIAKAVRDIGKFAVAPIAPTASVAGNDDQCGAGGNLTTCVVPEQPSMPSAPQADDPTPATETAAGGNGGPPSTTVATSSCTPDPADDGALKEGDVGTKRELDNRGVVGDELEGNHMPQAALLDQWGILPLDGGAMALSKATHKLTRTYFGRGRITARLDRGRPFQDVLNDDFSDLRGLGACFDVEGSIDALTEFWQERGMLP